MAYEFNEEEQEDTTVAMCLGCCSVVPDSIASRDKFLQAGEMGICKFCGGPVTVTDMSQVEAIRTQRGRGEIVS